MPAVSTLGWLRKQISPSPKDGRKFFRAVNRRLALVKALAGGEIRAAAVAARAVSSSVSHGMRVMPPNDPSAATAAIHPRSQSYCGGRTRRGDCNRDPDSESGFAPAHGRTACLSLDPHVNLSSYPIGLGAEVQTIRSAVGSQRTLNALTVHALKCHVVGKCLLGEGLREYDTRTESVRGRQRNAKDGNSERPLKRARRLGRALPLA